MIKDITDQDRGDYNAVVTHPLQSFEWGVFRRKTGIKVIRKGLYEQDKLKQAFTITIHSIPRTSWTIGYLPKCTELSKELLEELQKIGKEYHCIFIQLEPNIIYKIYDNKTGETKKSFEKPQFLEHKNIVQSTHPLFTKFSFVLNLDQSEEELLQNMHSKTRYNIRVAQKHNVQVAIDNDAFETYWKLTEETTKRQKFYAHTKKYHELWWETLHQQKGEHEPNRLIAEILTAKYNPADDPEQTTNDQRPTTLVAWVLFRFHDTLYYPYGASSNEYRNVMASNLQMWEAIKFGKKHGLKSFDMWGSMGPNPDMKDPWYGFHRLKSGYGGDLVEFVGSYDLVINPMLYQGYKIADKLRWMYLKLKK